jgi:hypothetical protein
MKIFNIFKYSTSPNESRTPVGDLDTENELVHNRITWLLTGQTLLLVALSNLVSKGTSEQLQDNGLHGKALEFIPLVGYWSAFAVLIGVLSAVVAFIKITRREGKEIGVSVPTTIGGFIPSISLPLIFMIAWYKISPGIGIVLFGFALLAPFVVFVLFIWLLADAICTKRKPKDDECASSLPSVSSPTDPNL